MVLTKTPLHKLEYAKVSSIKASKHLKGQLGPRVGDVTFFNHGGQLGTCVGDVTFFNHGGRLNPVLHQNVPD